MNWKEHLILIAMEECGEVALEIVNKNSPEKELNDLFAVMEMLHDEEPLEINKIEIKESILESVLKLQYFLSKSGRFGFNDCHPETEITNKKEIEDILSRLISIYPEDIDAKNKKKEKVLHFSKFSREQNLLS